MELHPAVVIILAAGLSGVLLLSAVGMMLFDRRARQQRVQSAVGRRSGRAAGAAGPARNRSGTTAPAGCWRSTP